MSQATAVSKPTYDEIERENWKWKIVQYSSHQKLWQIHISMYVHIHIASRQKDDRRCSVWKKEMEKAINNICWRICRNCQAELEVIV